MLLNIFFSLFMLFFPTENPTVIPSSPEYLGETTTTGIGYGRPTAACDGSGVCFVSESLLEMEDNFGTAKLTFGRAGTVTSIHALTKSMTKNTIKKHFSGTHFIMQDPYKTTLKIKGKSLKIYIPVGKHSIEKTESGFLIQIRASSLSEVTQATTTTGVGFGRPTAACDGAGVCFVSAATNTEKEDNFANAKLSFGKNGTVKTIHASAKSMTENTIKKHFSGTHFIMHDPYRTTLKLKGKSLEIYIPSGKHSFKKTKSGFLIQIEG